MPASKHTNRLALETSPYLIQHANNPVDWYAWGEEAFEKARAEDKPILLSIGYSACHWCHVMERESFENEAIAALMNQDFVNIKVDREERPDVDAIYMRAVQMLTGQGGWPMTMFLTPEGTPFYGGTYFPPDDHYGRPGFPRLLGAVATAWKTQRSDIEHQSKNILHNLEQSNGFINGLPDSLLIPSLLDNAFNALSSQFNRQFGGFGGAPKFPQPANLDFLLHYFARSKRQEPLAMVEKTLQRMALGGIYDQLGGGFHRYSTDETWLVPHFEKMLYDNAQLAQIYCRAYQATGKTFYRGIAEETLEYVMREMTSLEGGFYSAQDADSEGVEGKFFVWTPEEITTLLGERDAEVFNAFYDVTPGGNWEENSILHVVMDAPEVAAKFGLAIEEAAEVLDNGRIKLFAEREKRPKPGLDDKILTAWNGLMLAAFAECAAVFDRDDFRQTAINNAEFVRSRLFYTDSEGYTRLYRTYRNEAAKLNGYLEDYAFYLEGLLHLYEATFDTQWIKIAHELMLSMIRYFLDEENGGFFTTSSDHEKLIQRPKDWDDNATPSGNSVAVEALLKMAFLYDDSGMDKVARVLRKLGPVLEKHPYGFARMLGVLDLYLSTPKQVAIIGEHGGEATRALLRAVYATYLPNKVVALGPQPDTDTISLPLLEDRTLLEGKPTVYVCKNFICNLPVTDPGELLKQLQEG